MSYHKYLPSSHSDDSLEKSRYRSYNDDIDNGSFYRTGSTTTATSAGGMKKKKSRSSFLNESGKIDLKNPMNCLILSGVLLLFFLLFLMSWYNFKQRSFKKQDENNQQIKKILQSQEILLKSQQNQLEAVRNSNDYLRGFLNYGMSQRQQQQPPPHQQQQQTNNAAAAAFFQSPVANPQMMSNVNVGASTGAGAGAAGVAAIPTCSLNPTENGGLEEVCPWGRRPSSVTNNATTTTGSIGVTQQQPKLTPAIVSRIKT